jgi:hypothetical protein
MSEPCFHRPARCDIQRLAGRIQPVLHGGRHFLLQVAISGSRAQQTRAFPVSGVAFRQSGPPDDLFGNPIRFSLIGFYRRLGMDGEKAEIVRSSRNDG